MVFGLVLLLVGCSSVPEKENTLDPLPSWNEGAVKLQIVDFVEKVTDPNNESFVAVEDRIATFDNDGNLWSEQPLYFQLIFAMDEVHRLYPEHPEWDTIQPFKGVLENDTNAILKSGMNGVLNLVMASHSGLTTEEFNSNVADWLNNTKHPRFNVPYNQMIYQPMLELLNYLRANDFKTFIVSGGGIDFMRAWVTDAYGIPSHQVVGSSGKTAFEYSENGAVVRKLPEIDFIDDKEGKPVGIQKFIGKRPIFASGNSDGDLQMLQYTTAGEGARFALYLHHTDSEREWAYDRDSHIGKLDVGLDFAQKNGWSVIDMANDWNVVYPFQLVGKK